MTGFTAPKGGSSNKLETEPLSPGQHVCTLYGIAAIGTQDSKFYEPKPQIVFMFEFPQEMRTFYEGEAPKPCAVIQYNNFSMYKESKLRKDFVQPMINRKLTDEEADSFDFSTLLGRHFMATITPNGEYSNITSISPLDERNMRMFDLNEPVLEIINDKFMFHPGMGFDSENFKSMPKFLREKAKLSHEGKEFAERGGKFAEPEANNTSGGGNFGQQQGPSGPQSQTPTFGGKKIEMLPHAEYSYEAYKKSNWTDEQLVQNGLAKWKEATTPPQPQAAPAPSPAPQTPAQPAQRMEPAQPSQPTSPGQSPQTPPTTQASQPQQPQESGVPGFSPNNVPKTPAQAASQEHPIKMNDPSQESQIDLWLQKGWTYESIVGQGLATWK